MLTCGLLRTNFSFDTGQVSSLGRRLGASGNQVVPELLRDFSVVIELHGVSRAASGAVAKVGGIPEHRSHRDKTGDGLYTRSCGNSSDFSPSGMQIAEDVADVLVGSHHLERHDRLEDGGRRLLGGLDERSSPGDLEGVRVRIHWMIAAADHADPEVDHRVAGQHAALDRLRYPGLDGGSVLLWDLAGRCAILVHVAAAAV